MPIATTLRVTLVLVVLLASTGGPPTAAQQPAPGPASQSFTASATAILVDVVVRDRAGRPVTTLSAGDFEVSEDRVVQKIESFTRVSRGGGIGVGVAWRSRQTVLVSPTDTIDPVAAATPADEATTALVFDHLSAETLRLAQKATLDYVPPSGDSTVKVGVFATDPGVRVLQRYTTDRVKVRRAVERVLPGGTSDEEQSVARNDDLVDRRRELRGQNATGHGGSGGLDRCFALAQRHGDRRTRERAAPDSDRAQHAPVVRQSRPQPAGTGGDRGTRRRHWLAGGPAGPQDRRLLLRRAAGVSRALGPARRRHRRRQPRQRDDLRGRRSRAALEKRVRPAAARSSTRSPTSGCISSPTGPTGQSSR